MDLATIKKNKISLSDYNYQRDIENRLLLSQFSEFDHSVLEEILFSPIRTPIRKIAKNLSTSESLLMPVLQKLSQAGLLIIEEENIVVDKEVRKYFEVEIEKFEPDFIPGMEFLQHLLKKIPIHLLPVWYSIPRTSNNIFESLVEKYLHTPQIFQRHLLDLNFGNPVISAIAQEVFASPELEVSAQQMIKKFQITQEQFTEYMLILELHFVCCLKYQKVGQGWEERVSPFYEWREYLTHLKQTTPSPIPNPALVARYKPHDFSFIEEMSALLQSAKKEPILVSPNTENLFYKLQLLKLAEIEGGALRPTAAAADWLEMRVENRAIYLYRHGANRIRSMPSVCEKLIREAEKSILRVLHSDWILFEDFLPGVLIPLGDHPPVSLKKSGKSWKYARPEYSPQERQLIHATVFEWLFEAGLTAIGTYKGKECFKVTAFGQSLFG